MGTNKDSSCSNSVMVAGEKNALSVTAGQEVIIGENLLHKNYKKEMKVL